MRLDNNSTMMSYDVIINSDGSLVLYIVPSILSRAKLPTIQAQDIFKHTCFSPLIGPHVLKL